MGSLPLAQLLVNAEHYGRAGANPPSLTVRDHVYICRLVPCFISFFPQLNCRHGHVTVPVDIGILLVNAEHYGRAGANPPSLTVRDHVYICRLVPCFISFFPQLNCRHGHVTVPVDIGILLLYIYNYAHLVFNEIT